MSTELETLRAQLATAEQERDALKSELEDLSKRCGEAFSRIRGICGATEQDGQPAESFVLRMAKQLAAAQRALAESEAAREGMRAALEAMLVQAEGCWLHHYGENPEGGPEPSHLAQAKAALAAPPSDTLRQVREALEAARQVVSPALDMTTTPELRRQEQRKAEKLITAALALLPQP